MPCQWTLYFILIEAAPGLKPFGEPLEPLNRTFA